MSQHMPGTPAESHPQATALLLETFSPLQLDGQREERPSCQEPQSRPSWCPQRNSPAIQAAQAAGLPFAQHWRWTEAQLLSALLLGLLPAGCIYSLGESGPWVTFGMFLCHPHPHHSELLGRTVGSGGGEGLPQPSLPELPGHCHLPVRIPASASLDLSLSLRNQNHPSWGFLRGPHTSPVGNFLKESTCHCSPLVTVGPAPC